MPRFRVYDNGESVDRYTIVFCSDELAEQCGGEYPYLAASGEPFHPQGFGQHGGMMGKPVDTIREDELVGVYLEFSGYVIESTVAELIRKKNNSPYVRWSVGMIEKSEDYRAYFENADTGSNSAWWVPVLGKTGHLGKRIRFRDLPPNTRKFAAQNFRDYYLTPDVEDEEDEFDKDRDPNGATCNCCGGPLDKFWNCMINGCAGCPDDDE